MKHFNPAGRLRAVRHLEHAHQTLAQLAFVGCCFVLLVVILRGGVL